MKSLQIWRVLSATVLGLVLVLAGCDDSGDGGSAPPPVATGTVSGMVVVSSTGASLAGVTVSSAGRSTRTAADGSYTLTDVPSGGGQVITFDLPGHARIVRTEPVATGATKRPPTAN